MGGSSDDMMKLVLDSKALSIWNRKTGPVFWYAAGVPGPFYLNTEQMIGKALADELLEKITAIIADNSDPAIRAAEVEALIIAAYDSSAIYKTIIQALIAKAKAVFPAGSYMAVSGGERRDWLFSIPFAKEMGIKHAYLFKNKSLYCAEGMTVDGRVLHVADLINNAASYFDAWLPMLEREKLRCMGTLCVNTRGTNGLKRLTEAGYTVASLNAVDLDFFVKSRAKGLIDQDMLDEITLFFRSAQEWGAKYLTRDARLFDVPNLDKKSFERLQSFFAQDPWELRDGHTDFFAAMQRAIEARKAL